MYTLSLEIINKCNLNCTYCYLGEKKNTYMSLERLKRQSILRSMKQISSMIGPLWFILLEGNLLWHLI